MTGTSEHHHGAVASLEWCPALTQNRKTAELQACSRERGHDGMHQFIGDDGSVLAQWTSSRLPHRY